MSVAARVQDIQETTRPKPRPAKPNTEGRVLEEIRRLHDCLHKVGTKVDFVAERVEALDAKHDDLRTEVAYVRGRQDAVAERIGITPEGQPNKAPITLLSRAKLVGTILGIVIAMATLYPLIAAVAAALHEAILTRYG